MVCLRNICVGTLHKEDIDDHDDDDKVSTVAASGQEKFSQLTLLLGNFVVQNHPKEAGVLKITDVQTNVKTNTATPTPAGRRDNVLT
jgi:hypothetical protein